MEEWKEYKLGDVLCNKGYIRGPFGSALKRGDLLCEGIPVYEQQHAIYNKRDFRFYISEDKYNEMKRFTVYPDDIIISCSGTVGEVSLIKKNDPKGIISQALLLLRADNKIISPEFLLYFFKTAKGHNSITSRSSGSVQVNIARREPIEDIPLFIPCIEKQKRIVSILKSLDDKIEVNRKINENLEQQAQALFKSWFVDFEPFKDGEFVESELGMIPKGWRVGTFGEIMNITSGKRPAKKESTFSHECNIPLVGASDIMGYTNSVLFNEDILVIGRVGTHGIVQRFNYPCWPSDNTLVIKSDYYEYCYQVLCSIDYTSLNRGSTQPLITQTDIKNQLIIIPPQGVINEYEKCTSTLMKVVENNQQESRRLAELRDTLLPKLMSNEIQSK